VLAADPLRPQFHLLPKYGWMNDPNAPVYWRGKYHMFFQYNPGAAVWGDMHWDHAVSEDMVHWRHLGVALAPSINGAAAPVTYDADGCFTGSFVDDNGMAAIIYTGVQSVADPTQATLRDGTHNFRETQCLATTTDPLLRTWSKLPAPVIASPPPGMDVSGFRDPSVWRDGDYFYMTVGSGIRKKGGMVLLYRSPAKGDAALQRWEYLHPVAEGRSNGKDTPDSVDSGDMWECPELFPLDGQHVLIYSSERQVFWQTGVLDPGTMRFEMKRQGKLDGGAYYAPKTQLDAKGNRILWGWVSETRPDEMLKQAGWAGCISLPRRLGIDERGVLTMTPAAELAELREMKMTLPAAGTASREARNAALHRMVMPPATLNSGALGELRVVLTGDRQQFRLVDATGSTWLEVDSQPMGHNRNLHVGDRMALMGAVDELELRMYLDASVVEVFANGRTCLTVRAYRPPHGPLHMEMGAVGTTAPELIDTVKELEMWRIKPISKDRLTT
jgi:beta-fructofuranosidase